MNMLNEQVKPNRFVLRIALINLILGIEMFFMPFMLVLIKDVLPQSSVLNQSGGGDIIFVIAPVSFLITLVGLIMTIIALVKRKTPVPQDAPLTRKNKTALVFTALFVLINLRMTLMVIGLG